jgi:hypothetical protein
MQHTSQANPTSIRSAAHAYIGAPTDPDCRDLPSRRRRRHPSCRLRTAKLDTLGKRSDPRTDGRPWRATEGICRGTTASPELTLRWSIPWCSAPGQSSQGLVAEQAGFREDKLRPSLRPLDRARRPASSQVRLRRVRVCVPEQIADVSEHKSFAVKFDGARVT